MSGRRGATLPTADERAKAVVFAVLPKGSGAEPGGDDPLAEIHELLRSADIDWVGDVVQHRGRPDAHAYLGRGKMAELRSVVKATGATIAVCEDDLSPGQVAAVLDAVDVDVLDRTELILTVFARHAHSLEGTLQVHLAQLEYELTRMRGKGVILSRLGAGVDMRGPGETKLEVDRRVVRRRIQVLRRRIDRMAKTRRTQRARRLSRSVPLIALAGYTNAGKSTLLNALTDAHVPVADRLFETLDPTSRAFRHRDRDYVVTDTVGFIRKLPHQLVDAFASTLEETTLADVVLIVADASLDATEVAARQETVAEVLDMIGSHAPRLVVFNKVDLVTDHGTRARLEALYPDASFISAATGEGLEGLKDRLADFFDRTLVPVRLLFPFSEGAARARLRGVASDVREEHTPDGVLLEARLPAAQAARYAHYTAAAPSGPSRASDAAATAAQSPSGAVTRSSAPSGAQTVPSGSRTGPTAPSETLAGAMGDAT